MSISKIFSNVSQNIKTSSKIRKAKSMLEDYCLVKAKKLANDSFEINGFRNLYKPNQELRSTFDVFAHEKTPSYIIKYNPKDGLESLIRGTGYTQDVFYKIVQKPGTKPELTELITSEPNNAPLIYAKRNIEQIMNSLGKIIPTLEDLN